MAIRYFAAIVLLAGLAACGKSPAPADQPKPAEASHAVEVVALTAGQIKSSEIVLAQAEAAPVRETIALFGVVAPNAERVRDVAARFPGVIRSVSKRVGDPVAAGETLAQVESNESLQAYSVTAPLAGVITARNANPGEQTGEKPLFTVADLSTVWVEIALFPRDVGKVQVGQAVLVRSADTGQTARGRISYRAPFGTSANQTLTARVLLENPARTWAPGLYVSADVVVSEVTAPVTVRNEALQSAREQTVVFVQTDRGFEARAVRLGRKDREVSEVLDGIKAGEVYATRNSFILAAELGKGEAASED